MAQSQTSETLVSANINAQDGSASGGQFNHSRIMALWESARVLEQVSNVPDNVMPQFANGVRVAVAAQAEKLYYVDPAPPAVATSGPLNGTNEGFYFRVTSLAGAKEAEYFIPFSALSNLNLAAVPAIKYFP